MLFGMDDEDKKIKEAFEVTGASMSTVKSWIKIYDKTKKAALKVMKDYYASKEALAVIVDEGKKLESIIQKKMDLSLEDKNSISEIVKVWKKNQKELDFEFVMSSEDTDFMNTLSSLINLSDDFIKGKADHLIYQSEVENLIALGTEGLRRERPDLFALTFYYMNFSNSDLKELNFTQKIKRVSEFFESDFVELIRPILDKSIQTADEMYKEGRNTDKISIFVNKDNKDASLEQKRQQFITYISRI